MAWPVGKKLSPEHKTSALSALSRGREVRHQRYLIKRAKISKFGSVEHRLKLSIAQRGPRPAARKPKSLEHRAKISSALKGKPKSDSHRESLRRSAYKRTPAHKAYMASIALRTMNQWPKPRTNLEIALYSMLNTAKVYFISEKRFGRYKVDTYLPEYNMIIEADGKYWHTDREREEKRDRYLLQHVDAISHLDDDDLNPFL